MQTPSEIWVRSEMENLLAKGFVNLPVRRTRLPENEISFYIVLLDLAYPASSGTGHLLANI